MPEVQNKSISDMDGIRETNFIVVELVFIVRNVGFNLSKFLILF